MKKIPCYYIDHIKKKIFFGYKITNNCLEVFVYDANDLSMMFPITVSHYSSKSPCAYVDLPLGYYWLITVLEEIKLIHMTGRILIKNYSLNECRFDLFKMIEISNINSDLSFVEETLPSKKTPQVSIEKSINRPSINSYGLTTEQMKEALKNVSSSDQVEEAIEMYKWENNIK